jgi:alkylation response protein AidB-like acyl-CoA dehydrogenase
MEFNARAKVRSDAGTASQLIWEAVDTLASASGGSFAASSNLVNRYWRDVRVASLHGVLCTTTSWELYGRLLCGQEANTPLV